MINIEYENEPCSMILFRNWTQNFKYQFSKAHNKMEEMIHSTISDTMEMPANSILMMLKELSIMMESIPGATQLTNTVINTQRQLVNLIYDMKDYKAIKMG